ncbi:hypothetical protein SAICODRAFT_71345 [Saitoella complicata NRRL Y-17804]|uniref:uncharacterized protein n=1 Tax=Saitoella complicata (strain BCRC 22490 / CBS 7301 / JCM 7358 / NBRC 10748 / NRRL Y-17804) TaxID=698492 RepID=UPI00086753EF|nr:uncharacterized protein SAICODRAFT_71345 [Saitoella complicata NRRL Y-17804]ODQ52919.1 hypothetical protein SAICODRAFT_71345 [Saitoella complicata NRRL Y-17804]
MSLFDDLPPVGNDPADTPTAPAVPAAAAAPPAVPKPSLYGDLLTGGVTGPIERAPVRYDAKLAEREEANKINEAALRFQPILTRRPAPLKKPVLRPLVARSTTVARPIVAAPVVTTSLDDWTESIDIDPEPKRRAPKRKKSRPQAPQWDDEYDPAKPCEYEDYLRSAERVEERREWRNRNVVDDKSEEEEAPRNMMFAPPGIGGGMNFAPPPTLTGMAGRKDEEEEEDDYRPSFGGGNGRMGLGMAAPVPPSALPSALAPIPEETAEEAYARRMYLSAGVPPPPPPVQPQAPTFVRPAGPTPSMPTFIPASAPPEPPSHPISPPTEEQRSLRPGQRDFASRLMSKYGWQSGTGLGADPSRRGILHALTVEASKERKGTGRILDANPVQKNEGRFGKTSKVVVLMNMVGGRGEVDDELGQEIGEECEKSYGKVERCFVYSNSSNAVPDGEAVRVFVKFTAELSGLRAVNALDGRLFAGREVRARFYDQMAFDQGRHNLHLG